MKILNLILAFVLLFVFTACENKTSKERKYTQNNTITVLSPNFDKAISGPIKIEAKEFSNNTNSIVRVVTPSWDEMSNKIKESLEDDRINYDIFVVFASWGGSILNGVAEEIPNNIKEKIDWDDILPIYKENVLSWNKKQYFFPYDGDSINLYYRKDILNNIDFKNKFKKIYGYGLKAPKTWSQFKDIAEFFNGWDWDEDGNIEYGFAGSRVKGYGTTLMFLTRAAAYTKHPNDNAYYFDLKTMKPKINNPGFVKALNEYTEIMQFAPKQIINFAPRHVRQSFITGDVLLAIDWANMGAMSQNSPESLIKDKIGFTTLPGSNKVYNHQNKKWDNTYNAPSSIAGNWVLIVNKNSKNKELAYEFASHISSKEITNKYVVKGWSGVNPSRSSHLSLNQNFEEWKKNGFGKDFAKEYLKIINESLSTKNTISDIRIPGANLYYESLEKYLDKAIKKELKPKEALDLVAKEWEKITNELGLENQLKLYKESINE